MIVYRHPGLQGLEIWRGLARSATLDQLRDDKPAYRAALAAFLFDLQAGTARTADSNDLSAAAGFDRLTVTGGDACSLGWPGEVIIPGPYGARAGAEALWREFGWRRPAAIDLGQTRLKLFTPEASLCLERDEAALPFGRYALEPELGRARLREFVAAAIPPDCDGVLLALPAAIRADGSAEPCSYPGLFGPLAPVFGALFEGRGWTVCNDSVLAARGYPPPAGEKSLVLTIGFGVGAAVWG